MRRILTFISLLLVPACLPLPPLELRGSQEPAAVSSANSTSGKALQIFFPYVGQGDGSLFRFPNGKILLVDAGPPAAGSSSLLPLLRSQKIQRLDALVVTHYDLDHLGGVASLLAGEDGVLGTPDDIKVGTAYDRGGTPWDSSPGYGAYLSALDQAGIPRRTLGAGESLNMDDAVKLRCLAANGAVSDGGKPLAQVDLSIPSYSGKENAASIALLLEYGSFRYLTAGDLTGGGSADGFLTPDVETLLGNLAGAVDIVHVNHHGSLSSSNHAYVTATRPRAAVIQAGKDNPYHHPVPEVVERWRSVGAEVYSTEGEQGFILTTEGEGFEVKLLEAGP